MTMVYMMVLVYKYTRHDAKTRNIDRRLEDSCRETPEIAQFSCTHLLCKTIPTMGHSEEVVWGLWFKGLGGLGVLKVVRDKTCHSVHGGLKT